MQELMLYIARSLVDHPDEVTITQVERDEVIVLELRVAADDMGKVIGKQGRIAKAMRTLLKSAANHGEKKYLLEIV